MRIALAQFIAGPSPDENLPRVCALVDRAAEGGADLVVFPEASSQAFGTGPLRPRAEGLSGRFASGVRRVARNRGVTVVVGMFTPADDGTDRVFNTALVTGPEGEAAYRKIHLFDAQGSRESATVAPGSAPLVVEAAGARIGVMICFDLRFPELARELARRGAEILVLPSSWADGPGKRRQWRILTRARALDAGAFVVACDQARPGGRDRAGVADGPTGIGHSVVVGPEGDSRVEAGWDEDLLWCDIDPGDAARARARMPILGL